MPAPDPDRHLPLRPVDFLVLVVLADGPRHGYALAQEVERRSRGKVRVRPGDLYRVLYRMDGAGLIEPAPATSRQKGADDRRAIYRITPLGRRVARSEARLLADVAAGLLRRPLPGGERAS